MNTNRLKLWNINRSSKPFQIKKCKSFLLLINFYLGQKVGQVTYKFFFFISSQCTVHKQKWLGPQNGVKTFMKSHFCFSILLRISQDNSEYFQILLKINCLLSTLKRLNVNKLPQEHFKSFFCPYKDNEITLLNDIILGKNISLII